MTERKFFRVTTQGKEQLKSLNLNDVEMDTVLLALHGSLGSEIKKRGKITKGVLCETMMKIITLCDAFVEQIPCSGSASPAQIEQAQKETEDKFRKDLEEVKLTVAGGAKNDSQEDAVTGGSQETICRFYKVGRCKFSKKKGDDGEAKCPRSHPPTCRAFDDKGPDGCKSEPCPKGKYQRKVCAKLLTGECQRKAGNCYWYHPPLLSQKIKAQQKKKKEEEEKLEMRQMLEEMRSLRQPQVMQFPVQMPYPFYTMPQPVPTPVNSGSKKQ